MISGNLSGGVARFRVLYDDGPSLFPATATFDAGSVRNGTPLRAFSFTFVGRAFTSEGSDGHVYTVQWRHLSGKSETLHGGILDLLYHRGSRC